MCTPTKITASPPRKRWRSVCHALLGDFTMRAPMRMPSTTDAVSSAHASKPLERAMYQNT